MNGRTAFCPRCQRDTHFVDVGGARKCSVCGMEFEVAPPRIPEARTMATEAMGVFQVIFRVLLIMLAIVVVGVAVLFAGCALLMSGAKF